MALKTKTDFFFGGNIAGLVVENSTDNYAPGYVAKAPNDGGFTVAIDVGGAAINPTADYVVAENVNLSAVNLGGTEQCNEFNLTGMYPGITAFYAALGGITINTAAGQAPKFSANGTVVTTASGGCVVPLDGLSVSPLYHAQTFGAFTVTNGQLQSSNLQCGALGTYYVDGKLVSWELIGGDIVINGTIIGCNDSGTISTPTITCTTLTGHVKTGTVTLEPTLINNSGEYPIYNFEITLPLAV